MQCGQLVDKTADQRIELAEAAQGFAGDGAREAGVTRVETVTNIERRIQWVALAQYLGQNLLRCLARLQALRFAHAQGPGFCGSAAPASARRRTTRSSVEGWLENSP